MPGDKQGGDTTDRSYTARLVGLQLRGWKQLLDVQAPYRWNLRKLLGDRRVLDVGCGIGRNLAHLGAGSVGVDHNEHSVLVCRQRGLTAYTPDEFAAQRFEAPFEGILAAHVLEHLPEGQAAPLLRDYLPRLQPGGRVVLICPQQRGFTSDATHTVFFDDDALRQVCEETGLEVQQQRSFPLPRWMGKLFTYNEFVTVATYS
ncbi:MAG TPA: methyltransferase domain-containing protein [Pseudonocardiaceae bacterium]|nr:methyltransferase domain-containing protein [Pseudonocardiaceae bacterium]